MERIIPGYFMPIWQDIMMTKRSYAISLLSKLTLIPEYILNKNVYFYRSKEDFLDNFVDNLTNVYIYFDYKYCVISISKDYYKKVVLESSKALEDIDINKTNNKLLNICINFENYDELITKEWKYGANIDYLFLNIGIKYLKRLSMNREWSELERYLYPLVIEDYNKLSNNDSFGFLPIVKCYNNSDYYLNWYRTYKDYCHYNYLVNKIINF